MVQGESIETSRGQSTKHQGKNIFIRLEDEGNQQTMEKGSWEGRKTREGGQCT